MFGERVEVTSMLIDLEELLQNDTNIGSLTGVAAIVPTNGFVQSELLHTSALPVLEHKQQRTNRIEQRWGHRCRIRYKFMHRTIFEEILLLNCH